VTCSQSLVSLIQ